ncbi:MAG: hypothetical protein D6815_01885 [Candidatus Dadabacteria bacterium]|nr:MAG: hypothetical protein D6815_01885 [Candidatus Dadabacteria bacterium]
MEAAAARCSREPLEDYGPFSLVIASESDAVVLTNVGGRHRFRLPRGLSVLTNVGPAEQCPRRATARRAFEQLLDRIAADPPPDRLVPLLAAVLADHRNTVDPSDENPLARLCVHAPGYGTRSATILVVEAGGATAAYHADGPPCSHEFRPIYDFNAGRSRR